MANAGGDIRPYKIKVSSRYIDLTRQKLELTRLPHEGSEPKSEDWWEPKALVEPMIDFWLEKYSWRDVEEGLNKSLPQFRTALALPSLETRLRLHFIHVRSPHHHAVPLLLIPPFPFTNLSLGHLTKEFTDPENAATTSNQPFHLVVPSLPGVGFSDPLPNKANFCHMSELLDMLMRRLAYPHYLVSTAGAGNLSPAEMDWRLADDLARRHADSCLGTHLISPPLSSPRVAEAPWEWTKWVVARFFGAGILGYSDVDLEALARDTGPTRPSQLGLREPNTLAYALCDSPTGMLVFVLKGLHALGSRVPLSHEQVVTLTNLAWLPGPEYAMRLWARCAVHAQGRGGQEASGARPKPRVAITTFLCDDNDRPNRVAAGPYVPPAWARAHYHVLHAQRVAGTPGLLAWERPGVIAAGVRGLAREVLRLDGRLKTSGSAVAPLERAVTRQEPVIRAAPVFKLATVPEVVAAAET